MAKPSKKPAKKELGKKDLKKTRGGLQAPINLRPITSQIPKLGLSVNSGPPEPE